MARWTDDILAAITKDGGPIGPHPDPETQRLHTENPPKRRCPVPAPKNDHYEAPLHIEDPPAATVETPAADANPEDAMPARLALPEPAAEELAALRAAWEETWQHEPWSHHTNPPSRCGWRWLFRWAA